MVVEGWKWEGHRWASGSVRWPVADEYRCEDGSVMELEFDAAVV